MQPWANGLQSSFHGLLQNHGCARPPFVTIGGLDPSFSQDSRSSDLQSLQIKLKSTGSIQTAVRRIGCSVRTILSTAKCRSCSCFNTKLISKSHRRKSMDSHLHPEIGSGSIFHLTPLRLEYRRWYSTTSGFDRTRGTSLTRLRACDNFTSLNKNRRRHGN